MTRCPSCGAVKTESHGGDLPREARELEDRARAVGLPWKPSDGHRSLFDLMPYYATSQRRYAALRRYLNVGVA